MYFSNAKMFFVSMSLADLLTQLMIITIVLLMTYMGHTNIYV